MAVLALPVGLDLLGKPDVEQAAYCLQNRVALGIENGGGVLGVHAFLKHFLAGLAHLSRGLQAQQRIGS
ncbi:hypothetical protein D3C87_2182950 [compost metagenome]